MKKFIILRNVFIVLTLILSHYTCIVVAFNYADMLCGIAHRGFSAPADVAFIFAVPYYIAIVVCAVLALVFNMKARKTGQDTEA
ncbi:MAG: hypothetical protein IKL09_04680 [Clostridia bacterium]|nr:hypothetical protein [Clostridia bacterium]MBR6646792.1 hypothetical protein [Clostridia bacterium]